MSATNSDNSEMKVMKVKPEEIQTYLNSIGCNNLTVSGTFCKVLDEREQSLDSYSGATGNDSDTTGASDSNTSSSTSSGASKANIEFGEANIAFIMDLLQVGQIQELKVIDPTKTKEARTQKSKDERE